MAHSCLSSSMVEPQQGSLIVFSAMSYTFSEVSYFSSDIGVSTVPAIVPTLIRVLGPESFVQSDVFRISMV